MQIFHTAEELAKHCLISRLKWLSFSELVQNLNLETNFITFDMRLSFGSISTSNTIKINSEM